MKTNKNAKEIIALNEKLDKARNVYQSAIDSLINKLECISGMELCSNDFAGDGIGIGSNGDTYMRLSDLIEIIKEKGTFSNDDLFLSL